MGETAALEHRAFLSLGSNIDPERNLATAVRMLARYGRVVKVSSVWESRAVGRRNQPSFLNAALCLATTLSAQELKTTAIAAIERELGRVRTGDRYAPRTIDIDIMLFDSDVLQLGRRRIPDPEVTQYAHVAIPLAEIAPDLRHPDTGETMSRIAARFQPLPHGMFRRDDLTLGTACG